MPRVRVSILLLSTFAMCAFVGTGVFATEDSPSLSIEAFLEIPTLLDPLLSPDGSQAVFLRRQRSLEKDETTRQAWLAHLESGRLQRLSYSADSPHDLAFRPDGSLSFLAPFEDVDQVFLNPLDGTEPHPITEIEGGVSAYWWSPDGSRLALLAKGAEEEPVDEAAETNEDREDWEVFDRLEHPEEYPQLWIVTPRADGDSDGNPQEAPRQLTEAPIHAYHAAWSPDGTSIALTYNRRFSSLVDEDQSVALIDVKSGRLEQISPDDSHASMAAFSPDGKRLAYYQDRERELRTYLNLKDLVILNLDSRQRRVLTRETEMCLAGSSSTPRTPPRWSVDGKSLFLRAAKRTTLDLYRLDADSGRMARVTTLPGEMSSFDIVGNTLIYHEHELHRPGSIWVRSLEDGAEARLVASTDDAVKDFALQAPRKLLLAGHEGGFVEGFLFLPKGPKDKSGYPTIIEMHGGPYSRYGNYWTTRYPWQVLANEGFAVFIANPRGGTGYGQEFRQGNYRNFGTDDYLDLMAATDDLIKRGIADEKRLAFTGYSYGGLMTNVVISRTTRFKAAVSIAGIYNYVSAMGQSNPQLIIDGYRQPWAGDLQRLWEHSPASRADRIRTPTLVMHGTDDKPVDPRQSIELFSYLQLNGVPSRLVLYPGEGHGINRPSHMLDYESRELAWFRHYLLGDETAQGAEEPLPVEPQSNVEP